MGLIERSSYFKTIKSIFENKSKEKIQELELFKIENPSQELLFSIFLEPPINFEYIIATFEIKEGREGIKDLYGHIGMWKSINCDLHFSKYEDVIALATGKARVPSATLYLFNGLNDPSLSYDPKKIIKELKENKFISSGFAMGLGDPTEHEIPTLVYDSKDNELVLSVIKDETSEKNQILIDWFNQQKEKNISPSLEN